MLNENLRRGLLHLCISHLRSGSSLPNQFIEAVFLCRSIDFHTLHVGWTNGLVCLLCAFGLGMEIASLAIFLAIEFGNFFLARGKTQLRQVHAICTHVRDKSVFIQALRYHHGLTNRESQLTGSLLLQRRCGKWWSRSALHGFLAYRVDNKRCILAFLQECQSLFVRLEARFELCLHLALRAVGILQAHRLDAVLRPCRSARHQQQYHANKDSFHNRLGLVFTKLTKAN